MLTFLISTAFNFFVTGTLTLSIVRFIQGVGFGVSSTATGTIMARLVPSSRRGEGTSYYAMFVTTATAIGPFAGIYLYRDDSLDFNLIVSGSILLIGLIASTFRRFTRAEMQTPH